MASSMFLHQTPALKTSPRRYFLIARLVLLLLLLAGCERGRATPKSPEGTFPVDPVFQDFYKERGGRNILGPAISPVFTDQEKIYQYTIAGLMMYDRAAPEGQRVSLAPLGREMNVYELPSGSDPQPGERFEAGYKIFDKFVPLYEQLGGAAVVGKPLTETHKNEAKQRYEQYFENAGFYWLEGDRENAVHLLAYGAWMCRQHCQTGQTGSGRIDLPYSSLQPFVEKAALLGLDFSGNALSPPVNQGGQVNQIYQNVVFTADAQNPADVRLFALPEAVGIDREEARAPSPAPDMEFYAVNGTLGYNVPTAFVDYVQAHGGFEFIGEPINHVSRPDPQTIQQCFVSLCLQGVIDDGGEVAVHVLPLGLEYFRPENPTPIPTLIKVTIQVGEETPMISPLQEQEIWAVVMSAQVPVPNIEPELTVTLPDGSEQIYRMPATDEKGESRQVLPPLNAQNGTLVPYVVCVRVENQQEFCVLDSYLIWSAPTIEITPTLPPGTLSYLPFIIKNAPVYFPALIDQFVTYLPFIKNQD